jgi:hypothetical protein
LWALEKCEITMNVYGHALLSMEQEAAARLATMLH